MDELQPGQYRAVAVDWGLGRASTGTPQIAVVFDLLDRPGKQVTWYGYFTEKTIDRTLESLRHCGWTCDRIDVLEGLGESEVSLELAYETDDQGNERLRVRWVNRSSGVGLSQQMDEADLAAFARDMRGAAAASRQNYRRPSSTGGARHADKPQPRTSSRPPSRQPEPPPFDDEPPF